MSLYKWLKLIHIFQLHIMMMTVTMMMMMMMMMMSVANMIDGYGNTDVDDVGRKYEDEA